MPQNIYLHSALDWVRPWWRSDFGNHSFLCRRGLELQLAAVLHVQVSRCLPAAAEDARDQALSLAREAVQAEVAAFEEQQREELRLKFKSLDEVEGGFGTALMKTFPDFLPKPEMLGKTRQVLAHAT